MGGKFYYFRFKFLEYLLILMNFFIDYNINAIIELWKYIFINACDINTKIFQLLKFFFVVSFFNAYAVFIFKDRVPVTGKIIPTKIIIGENGTCPQRRMLRCLVWPIRALKIRLLTNKGVEKWDHSRTTNDGPRYHLKYIQNTLLKDRF